MNDEDFFAAGGLDELDTQITLFQLGIESFSPYANTGKVDMIIRTEKNKKVHYADIKVCSGVLDKKNVVWKLEISFFMGNESFLILTVRLPEEDDILEKHRFIIGSKTFLKIVKKEKLEVKEDNWILKLPYNELKQLLIEKNPTKLSRLTEAFSPFFDNWDTLTDWRG
jgi:hypothetical protein